jgi:hypothetical protein
MSAAAPLDAVVLTISSLTFAAYNIVVDLTRVAMIVPDARVQGRHGCGRRRRIRGQHKTCRAPRLFDMRMQRLTPHARNLNPAMN